jgi:aminocarboxymuconate-semialdehyde decarboxylase
MPKTIDVHAHILNEDTMQMIAKEAPSLGVKLTPIDEDFAVFEIGGTAYKPFPRGAWDLEQRFAHMKEAEVDMHVLSNTPQTFLYNVDASLNATVAAIQNDQIAKHVKDYPDRFYGLATLPMQAPDKAAAELKRAMTRLGVKGAQIGSNINKKNLDEPEFEPVWAVANEHHALMMVHPTQVAAMDRLGKYYLNNLIGNPLDSTIAVASVVFGGVVERYPNIKWFFVHGGGMAPWQAGRFSHGWVVRPEPKVNLKDHGPEKAMATLYYDTILHALPQLQALVSIIGPSRIVLGSDYPYDMGTLECARQVKALNISAADKQKILTDIPLKLVGNAGGT